MFLLCRKKSWFWGHNWPLFWLLQHHPHDNFNLRLQQNILWNQALNGWHWHNATHSMQTATPAPHWPDGSTQFFGHFFCHWSSCAYNCDDHVKFGSPGIRLKAGKFPPWRDNEADISSVSPCSEQNFCFILSPGWKFDPFHLVWYPSLLFHFLTDTAPQFVLKLTFHSSNNITRFINSTPKKCCSSEMSTPTVNPLSAEWALRAFNDFTLSNARWFYMSMGNPLAGKQCSPYQAVTGKIYRLKQQ